MLSKKNKNKYLKNKYFLLFFLALFVITTIIYFPLNKRIVLGAVSLPDTSFVTRSGKDLYLNGEKYYFTGVNAYELATLWNNNSGCGQQVDNIDGFFQSFRPNSVIRFWAWQGALAINWKTNQIDWTGIDRVVQSAEKNNQKLIVSLGSQDGSCDDGRWKNKSWYDDGYKTFINDGSYALQMTYIDYVKAIVERYKNSHAIAIWEPLNEPEVAECSGYKGSNCMGHQTCPDNAAAAKSLRIFFDTVGSAIKNIDSNHLIGSGVIGSGQCGAAGNEYTYIHESSFVDVASYHDYSGATTMPGDQWNGLQTRINQMNGIQKPIIIGEVGIQANDGVFCSSLSQRRDQMKAKMDAQFKAGIAGFLPWNWIPNNSSSCSYETIISSDPLFTLLQEYDPYALLPVKPLPSSPSLTPTSIDYLAPIVSITLPENRLTILANSRISIRANATDNIKVTVVEFWINNVYKRSDSTSAYTYSWRIPSTKNIVYQITAKAYDQAGNTSSSTISITSK